MQQTAYPQQSGGQQGGGNTTVIVQDRGRGGGGGGGGGDGFATGNLEAIFSKTQISLSSIKLTASV